MDHTTLGSGASDCVQTSAHRLDLTSRLDPKMARARDSKFFFDNGDCIFVAMDGAGLVVFKLHKMMLCRDPKSMFSDMFKIPHAKDAIHANEMEEIPISDTADEFRAICWALYALPPETQLQNDKGADIDRLLAVAKMGHKYNLVSYESWAVGMIWIHCQPGMDYLDECSPDMLRRIFEAAEQGGREDLCGLVEERWLRRLRTGNLQLRDALDFGEMHDRRVFLGKAYYQQAIDMRRSFPSTAGSLTTNFSQGNLRDDQLHRLMSGYCSLSLTWEDLSNKVVPRFAGCSGIRHITGTVVTGESVRTVDILKLAENAAQKVTVGGCRCRHKYLSTLADHIADHFLGKASENSQ